MAIHTTELDNDRILHTTVREYNDETREAQVVEKDFLGSRRVITHEVYHEDGTVDAYENTKILGLFDSKGKKIN